MTHAVKKILRSPRVIVGEIAALAVLCALGAALPQQGTASAEELARLQTSGPLVQAMIQAFSLDRVFSSAWFLAAILLTAASLLVIVVEQVKKLRAQWFQRLSPAHFQAAPFRIEFERPVESTTASQNPEPRIEIRSAGRLGLAGPAVFHAGLLLVMVAGALRALFGTDAVVDLFEGETLPPTAQAWAGQWPGKLAKPFQLDHPVTLNQVRVARYQGGDLQDLTVNLAVPGKQGTENITLAVNHDAQVDGQRLFLANDYGTAALVEWQQGGLAIKREAALLARQDNDCFEGVSAGPDGLRAFLRTGLDQQGNHPARVEVRVMRDNALLYTGDARVNETISLPTGEKLTLHGTALWARLRGSHDAALGLAYTGFALIMLGAALIFFVIKVDFCLVVTPLANRERVFIALRPQRYAALYADDFKELIRQQKRDGSAQPTVATRYSDEIPTANLVEPGLPATRLAGWLLLGVCLAGATGCQRSGFQEAQQLVERYNQVVAEAYRRGDVRLIDPVVGPNEGKKITGLIGVRLDLGITLDSQLLSLELTGVEKSKDEMRVRTKERWRYRDLKIGTGRQVGEESLDAYEMLYVFKQRDKAWLVDEIKFTTPPQVGRKTTPWIADRKDLHGTARPAQGGEEKQP